MGRSAQPDSGVVAKDGGLAESALAAVFENAGWEVRRETARGSSRPDILARRRGIAYAVALKVGSEGRSDRLVPLLAQAVLEARRVAGRGTAPLAIVAAPRIPRRVADQVIKFAQDYAPATAVGVMDFEGFRSFRGPHLVAMNAEAKARVQATGRPVGVSGRLLSDLNQWMLKVLLAPELPEQLLSAPRGRYRNASELARAARVSVMSAFRFVQQLQHEGYLDESASRLSLVRRGDLFDRWQGLSARSAREAPMRFVLPGNGQAQLRRALNGNGAACLALFAAADVLHLGFVSGVPPYVYVDRLRPSRLATWKGLRACAPGEAPDVIVREAPAPQSVFRGAVSADGGAACDVLQVWVDVAAHPSRGREQADLIRRRVLRQVIEGER
jgi:hypothetical protein